MAEIIISEAALRDAERLFDFFAELDTDAAVKAGQMIAALISRLEQFPESVHAVCEDFRILTVPFGKRGYSVAYVYEVETDAVRPRRLYSRTRASGDIRNMAPLTSSTGDISSRGSSASALMICACMGHCS